MPIIETKGAASAQGYGEFAKKSGPATYIEDVFSTYLYTGNSSTQTITNGIDLSTKGGMVWIKARDAGANNMLYDTARGAGTGASSTLNKGLSSNLTGGEGLSVTSDYLSAFNANGFSVTQGGTTTVTRSTNFSSVQYCSWAFRKQPKFFDIVTWTGNGVNGRSIVHNLGSNVGFLCVKIVSSNDNWYCWHRSFSNPNTDYLNLNATSAVQSSSTYWGNAAPTSTQFTVGGALNASGFTYVAYLFAHDAGGFGLTGTDNVISCGSFTDTSGAINLGYEPQFLLYKCSSTTGDWTIVDNMRGMPVSGSQRLLYPNTSGAEATGFSPIPTATGFTVQGVTAGTYIYIAIRRGPMKTPTTGTEVYNAIARTGTGSVVTVSGVGFPPDLIHPQSRNAYGANAWYDKLRGGGKILFPSSTGAEGTDLSVGTFNQDGFSCTGGIADYSNYSGIPYINHFFKRAPGFFDEVCYTGTSANRTVTHNLGVAPELIIVKSRSNIKNWVVGNSNSGWTKAMLLNSSNAEFTQSDIWNNTAPTSTVFSLGTNDALNFTNYTYVAYLFASCPGVSKVGSYTGNGSSQTINCGFTAGARFVMIKRTDSTGDWYVWDTARGMVAGNDPHLSLNTTAAEVTTDDSVDTDNSGFIVNQLTATNINVSSATYIYLAIA